jgi:GMP synthase-like glutamine amidotransferase
VYPNTEKEIGWLPVQKVNTGKENNVIKQLPDSFTTFHWHGDTFDLPGGAWHFLKSEACSHQAFLYGNHVMALQFHMEAVPELVADMVEHGKNELVSGPYIQHPDAILLEQEHYTLNNQLLLDMIREFVRS